MENHEKTPSRPENNDVDLGDLVGLFIKAGRKIVNFFGLIFRLIGQAILYILFFLKRYMIWIGLAVILGLAFGIFVDYKLGSKYEGQMTVRTNFGSARALYNSMDYLNSLVYEHKLKELSSIFSISETDAASVLHFDAVPVDDELMLADLYKEKFLTVNRDEKLRMDTFWTRIIKFEDFKKQVNKFDVPLHTITVISKHVDVFQKLQPGILNSIVGNEVLKRNQEMSLQTQKDEEKIIMSSIDGLDTLKRMYNLRIQKQAEGKENTTANLNLIDKDLAIKTPELDLYDKVLQMKDELRATRNNAMDRQDIIQVFSPFTPYGKKLNLLRQNSASYAIDSIVLVLILLIIIDIYKALDKTEKQRKAGLPK